MSVETVRSLLAEIENADEQPYIKPSRDAYTTSAPDPKIQQKIDQYRALAVELAKLDSTDFDPIVSAEFSVIKNRVIEYAKQQNQLLPECRNKLQGLSGVLANYAGLGSGGQTRPFNFIQNQDVRRIVERDFRELRDKLVPGNAWKSSIIMCGSILEAVLYDQLTKDQATINTAMASNLAPTRGQPPRVRNIASAARADSWSLENLIDVSVDIGLIPNDAGAIHVALRRFRNLVHPRVELRLGIPIGQGPAEASHGMLITILDHLS